MGYYLCPRCGSKDSYEGTEHVLHEKQGRQVTVDNGHGMAMSRVEGGGTERLELTLIKCRDCGETLGEKDFRLTEEEIQAKAEAKSRRLAEKRKETKRFNERFDKTVAFVVLIVSGLAIYFLILKIWG
jgi:hypothetical protein